MWKKRESEELSIKTLESVSVKKEREKKHMMKIAPLTLEAVKEV